MLNYLEITTIMETHILILAVHFIKINKTFCVCEKPNFFNHRTELHKIHLEYQPKVPAVGSTCDMSLHGSFMLLVRLNVVSPL